MSGILSGCLTLSQNKRHIKHPSFTEVRQGKALGPTRQSPSAQVLLTDTEVPVTGRAPGKARSSTRKLPGQLSQYGMLWISQGTSSLLFPLTMPFLLPRFKFSAISSCLVLYISSKILITSKSLNSLLFSGSDRLVIRLVILPFPVIYSFS